jgi:hypothetical protein
MPTKKPSPSKPLPDVELPPGPHLERHEGATPTLTANGLAAIELLAAEGFVQNAIASRIGLSAKQFKTLLGAADANAMTEARAAWEGGRARLESEFVRLVVANARKGNMISQLFGLKAFFAYKEGASTVVEGPKINFYSLPAPASDVDYMKQLGMAGPVDARDPQRRQIVLGSEGPDAPFGRYIDGELVPDFGGIGRGALPVPTTPPTNEGESQHDNYESKASSLA